MNQFATDALLISGQLFTTTGNNAYVNQQQLTPISNLQTISGNNIYKLLGKAKGYDLSTGSLAYDMASLTIPSNKYYSINLSVVANIAAGSLTAATVGVYTGAGGAGTAIISPTALTSLTSANLAQVMSSSVGNVLTGNLIIRVTVISLSSCNCDFFINGYDLMGQ